MEVTNIRDHVTHAIAGGKQAHAVGIADTPEFYHMLSSTLYSDQVLATVREPLCNAWDAHVEAGIQNIALEVTITSEKFIIRDFGMGIADALIQPIYGVYGGSTKRQNEFVTGGFGLGCKAPWSYVDHFQVTSFHYGEKTIYNMSKSSAQVMGKPMITPIVTIPTDESGLEVSINLKDPQHRHRFMTLVTRLAALGEMKVKLNGNMLPQIPFSKAENGYLLLERAMVTESSSHHIFVRYGHVVYPVEDTPEIQSLYQQAKDFLGVINGNDGFAGGRTHYVLVMQARPNTISITPSRESISVTEHTTNTINELLGNFLDSVEGKLEQVCLDFNKKAITETWHFSSEHSPAKLLIKGKEVVNPNVLPTTKANVLTNIEEMAGTYMRRTYPKFSQFYAKDIGARIQALQESRFGLRGLISTFRAEMIRGGSHADAKTWFLKKLVGSVTRRMADHEMDPKRLFAYTRYKKDRNYIETDGFITPVEMKKRPLEEYMPFLRGLIIVAYNRGAVLDRAHFFPMCSHWFGSPINSLVYFVPRNVEKAKTAVAYFQGLGYTVLDLTRYHAWEVAPEPEEKKVRQARAKKLTGWPTLASAAETPSGRMHTNRIYDPNNASRLEKPEFVVRIGRQKESFDDFGDLSSTSAAAFRRVFGARGVVVPTSTSMDKVIAETGAMKLADWLVPELIKEFKTNPLIEQHYRNTKSEHVDCDLRYDKVPILNMILRDEWLRKHFNLPPIAPQRERDIATIVDNFRHWQFAGKYKDIRDLLKSWKPSPALQTLSDTIAKSKLVTIIDEGELTAIFNNVGDRYKTEHQTQARNVLLALLKG